MCSARDTAIFCLYIVRVLWTDILARFALVKQRSRWGGGGGGYLRGEGRVGVVGGGGRNGTGVVFFYNYNGLMYFLMVFYI